MLFYFSNLHHTSYNYYDTMKAKKFQSVYKGLFCYKILRKTRKLIEMYKEIVGEYTVVGLTSFLFFSL